MNTVESLRALVAKAGGEKLVLGIMFNNAYRVMFTEEAFSFEQHVDEELNIFVFKQMDPSRVPYTVYKPIEYVEAVIFADKEENLPKYSYSTIAG